MEFYSLEKNHSSVALSSRFIGPQIPYQLQNLKILSTFQGNKNPHVQNFWSLIFLSENFFFWGGGGGGGRGGEH